MRLILLALIVLVLSTSARAGGWPVTPGAMYQDWSFTFVTERGRYVRMVLSQDSSGWNQTLNRKFFNDVEEYCKEVEGETCTIVSMIPLLPMTVRDKEPCEHYWTDDCLIE